MSALGLTTDEVGIEALNVYVPAYSLSLDKLARARGVDPGKYKSGLGMTAMAVTPPWEDAVTLAANAAAPLFDRGAIDRDEIGLLLVATESAVDHARPVSIFVHELLEMHSACRTYELKHACYSGTAALMTAAQWIASGASRGRKAMVIASDVARYELGSPGEPTQGAGAVAMIVSSEPRLLALEFRKTGSFASSVFDFWRPLERREAIVDGKYSVDCYLGALEGSYRNYRAASGGAEARGGRSFTDRFRAFLYHVPFPKMAAKAHRRLLELDWAESRVDLAATARETLAQSSFEQTVAPYLAACREIGNSYTASLYFCLATLLESYGEAMRGGDLALFSYGSGCCAELFSATVGPGARAARTGLAEILASRQPLSVEEYEAFRAEPEPSSARLRPTEGFRGRYFYAGSEQHRRRYFPVSR